MADEIVLETHDLSVSYDEKPVLWNIDFSIPKGKLVGIVGPNGAGKSTLLKSIMGILKPNEGWVKVFNQPIDERRDLVSYVPQRESVDWDFPISVLDVVLMGRISKRGLLKRYTKKDREIALQALKDVQMEAYLNRQIAQLSGGQQQRVFLARALAQQADLYLMDEPFAGVDATTEASILNLLQDMRSKEKTLLVVHHDLQSAFEYFDWIILLNKRLVACGPTSEVFTEKYLKQAYGGQLTLLNLIGDLMQKRGVKINE